MSSEYEKIRRLAALDRGQYEQEWPLPTMTEEQYDRTRGCPHRAHDCSCRGDCPAALAREARLRKRPGRYLRVRPPGL